MNYVGIPGIKENYRAKCAPVITAEKIIKVVCEHFGTTLDRLKTKGRSKENVYARHTIFYFIRKHTSLSLKRAGLLFNRDHTTVIHALEKLDDIMATEPAVRSEIEHLQATINALGMESEKKVPHN